MKDRVYNESSLPSWLNVQEVSNYLGLGLTSTYDLVNDVRCPKIVHGRRILIPRDKFLAYLEERIEEEQHRKDVI